MEISIKSMDIDSSDSLNDVIYLLFNVYLISLDYQKKRVRQNENSVTKSKVLTRNYSSCKLRRTNSQNGCKLQQRLSIGRMIFRSPQALAK